MKHHHLCICVCGVQLYEDDEITPPVLYIPFSTWPQTSTHGGSEAPRARLEKGIFRVPIGGTMKRGVGVGDISTIWWCVVMRCGVVYSVVLCCVVLCCGVVCVMFCGVACC